MAQMLLKLEHVAGDSSGYTAVTEIIPLPESFAHAPSCEQGRVLDVRGEMEVVLHTSIGADRFYNHDRIEGGVGSVLGANKLDLDGGRLPPSLEGGTRLSRKPDANLFLEEDRDTRRIHGKDALVLMATLLAEEELVALSGAQHMLPIRPEVPSVDGGGHCVTVGYVPQLPKALEHIDKARLGQ